MMQKLFHSDDQGFPDCAQKTIRIKTAVQKKMGFAGRIGASIGAEIIQARVN
jgi:hypothetical protein